MYHCHEQVFLGAPEASAGPYFLGVNPVELLRYSPAVDRARARGLPIVALESSVIAQGLPIPENRVAAARMASAVVARNATPAIMAICRGAPTCGLEADDLERFLARTGVRKVSARDLGAAVAQGADGATTVAGALALTRLAGIDVFATGGIGGVHRSTPGHAAGPVWDESADLAELARSPTVVVCSGAKSILDLPATLERLETLGVPVVGYQTSELPGFFTAETGIHLESRAESPEDVAAIAEAHWQLGNRQSVLVVQPPPEQHALSREVIEVAIDRALAEAERKGVNGPAVTPFLLEAVSRFTNGRSLQVNLSLLEQNAALAAAIACALHASPTVHVGHERPSQEV
jgi:pseudouridylate synthase